MDKYCIIRAPRLGDESLGPIYQVSQTPGIPIATLLWNKRLVTYAIGRLSKDLPMHYPEVMAINLAFEKWRVEANIDFKRVRIDQHPDILVEFVDPVNDSILSQDPKNIMGYSGFPTTSLQGHVRLNDSLNWGWQSVNFSWNVNNTLTHEIGHAIGMEHTSECPKCIMYPVYNGVVELGVDDIIQVITAYGKRTWAGNMYNRIKTAIHNILSRANP